MCEFISFIRIDVIILIQWLAVYALYIKFGKGSPPSLRAFMKLYNIFNVVERFRFDNKHALFLIYSYTSLLILLVNFGKKITC